MVATSHVEGLKDALLPYVDELREFFASRRLPAGAPDDLRSLAERLSDPPFHEEMVSMVRAIQYREEERLTRDELMNLLAYAAGGPLAGEQTPQLRASVREIFTFVAGVLPAQRGAAPVRTEVASHPAFGGPPAEQLPETIPDTDRALLTPVVPSPARAEETEVPRMSPVCSDARVRYPGGRTPLSMLRRAYWVPGVFALLAVSAGIFLLHRHPQTHTYVAVNPEMLPAARATQPGVSALQAPSIPPAQTYRSDAGTDALHVPPAVTSHVQVVPRAAQTLPRIQTRLAPKHLPAARPLEDTPEEVREGVFLASSGVMASHLLFAPAPAYPRFAGFTHVQGQVIVQVVVSPKGTVVATRVLDGPLLLRGAAEHAIRSWRYRPYVVEGKATDVATLVTVSFRLRH